MSEREFFDYVTLNPKSPKPWEKMLSHLWLKTLLFYNVLDHKLIDLFSRKSSPSSDSEDLIVIREIYDSENAQEIFEIELERAIQVSSCYII